MPDDPEIENMDPVMKAWMFYSWSEDYNDEFELLKSQGYLIGSFTNPDAVRRMMGKDSSTLTTTDKEFEESTRIVEEGRKIDEDKKNSPHRRKRRKIIKG